MLLSTAEGSSPGKKGHEYPTTSQSAPRTGTVVAPNDRNPALLASCWLHSLLSSRQTLLEFAQTPPHSPPAPGASPQALGAFLCLPYEIGAQERATWLVLALLSPGFYFVLHGKDRAWKHGKPRIQLIRLSFQRYGDPGT